MKQIEIFEPAMCCSTGVCGPGVDSELLRLSTLIESLKKKGIIIKRYNLTSNPLQFVKNKTVNDMLNKNESDILPLTLLDCQVVKTQKYPVESELSEWLGINIAKEDMIVEDKGCCSDKNSCDIRCSPYYKNKSGSSKCC